MSLKYAPYLLIIQGASKKGVISELRMFYVSYFIFSSSQEIYSSPLKIEISPVILHIISFHSSKFYIRYVWPKFMPDYWQLCKCKHLVRMPKIGKLVNFSL